MRYGGRDDFMIARVAIGGFLHETNTFAPSRADLAAFEQGGGYIPMTRGAALPDAAAGVNLGISGALEHAHTAGWQVVPLLWAGAIPSAHVTEAAYERIAGELAERLRAAGPLDGLFIDLHGAMVAEHAPDGEGELLARLRAVIGPDVPIATSLDLHGNITGRMVAEADFLAGFRTYPHVDMAETGRRAAAALGWMMETGTRPAKAFRRLPYMVPVSWQSTLMAPADRLYGDLAAGDDGPAGQASLFMGFPAADFAGCGPSVVVHDPDVARAQARADALAEAYCDAEAEFAGRAWPADAGVAEAQRLAATRPGGPVILADTQDNPGAGGDSNTTGLLRALVAADAQDAALGLMVDPAAAARAHDAGEGVTVSLALGGASGVAGDAPFEAEFTVERLHDGVVHATGPFYGGARLRLGPSACLRIGGVRVVVTSHKAQMADREMFRVHGIAPEAAAILAVKSSTHFRADFAPIAGAILVCTAPGPMPIDPAQLPWSRISPRLRLSPHGPTRAELAARAG